MTVSHSLKTALWEADRHLQVLESALNDWYQAPAANMAELEMNQERLRILDQVLFRLTKLQDAMGQRLIPATLAALSEPCEDWPMIDRLNRLEKLGFLDVDAWLRWRETRNRLAHEYPDHVDIRFAALLSAVDMAAELTHGYRSWRAKLESQLIGKP